MTNEEAIDIIKNRLNTYYCTEEDLQALDLAIKALNTQESLEKKIEFLMNERPQGKWIFDSEFTEFGNPYGTYKCDKCGGHSSNKYPFCFWCGSDMRTEVKE